MSQVRARKGVGAVPWNHGQEENRAASPSKQQGMDPPTTNTEAVYNTNVEDNKAQETSAEVGNGDDALLDLDQLEELHDEAERMKALGNKHMAAQEYTRAYNAYSAALQLSPVGPSSHVFLSNRSAALLSLKRYSAAATDARRAVALAPTFGKAHARLGQSLYFLKDYEGAVSAYEDAIHYEPDNPITKTYLEKARSKWNRQKEKALKNKSGEEVSVLTAESSVQQTVTNSVATDPNASAAVVKTGFRGQSKAIVRVVGGGIEQNNHQSPTNTVHNKKLQNNSHFILNENVPMDASGEYNEDCEEYNPDDPDFDEALRIQERANRYLANKNYKFAIEEYTAALFLVPDDQNLSPELHLGRAHALNGSRRHESAKIDSQLAIKIKATPEAYSTLAKSLFYMKDYEGSIIAFENCKELLPRGETLSMFDRAYLQKAEAAIHETSSTQSISSGKTISRLGSSAPIPKLKPPKFVSREEALTRTPNMPAMPKQWPQQSPRESKIVKYYGEEREVVFLSEALGIKLNRGPDGIVRVIEVSPDIAGSPITREGNIEVGDVIREAAGVDIRRPITNIMWGDTVALIKMAPRPIVLVVAKESSESIMDERKRAAHNALSPISAARYLPSNASTEDSVTDQIERQENDEQPNELQDEDVILSNVNSVDDSLIGVEKSKSNLLRKYEDIGCNDEEIGANHNLSCSNDSLIEKPLSYNSNEQDTKPIDGNGEQLKEEPQKIETTTETQNESGEETAQADNREEEFGMLGAEIIFGNNMDNVAAYNGWDNLRWMAFSGVRRICAAQPVFRFCEGRKGFLWSKEEFVPRILAVYKDPGIILILREASSISELKDLMDLPSDTKFDDKNPLKSYLFVESVIDPKTAKIRLSPLTTPTSIIPMTSNDCPRRRSTFELINPVEAITLSAVRQRKNVSTPNYVDSEAFLETSEVEYLLTKSICSAQEYANKGSNFSWKHQLVLGTLHSFVVLGNQDCLEKGINQAIQSKNGQSQLDIAIQQAGDKSNPRVLNSKIIDSVDESGKTALHYACERRFSSAVSSLLKAGADVNMRTEDTNMTPCHISSKNLDYRSLKAILSVSRRPNELDDLGRTPMYLAITEGRSVGGLTNPDALERCIACMAEFGGRVGELGENRHPVSYLAYMCQPNELEIVLKYSQYKYPLYTTKAADLGISLSALYEYPLHSALISLKHRFQNLSLGGCTDSQEFLRECPNIDSEVNRTLRVLFSFGFEPNEKIEGLSKDFREMEDLLGYVGFCPTQILMASILEVSSQRKVLGEDMYGNVNNLLANIMECLTMHGARVFADLPALRRSDDRDNFIKKIAIEEEPESTKRGEVKVQGSIELSLFVGRAKIVEALAYWKSLKPTRAASSSVLHDDKGKIDNSLAPGGSDEKTCAICWKKFGMITRKHRCRISRRFVCDECSSHRIVLNGVEYRVTDGQFMLAKAEEMKKIERNRGATEAEGRLEKDQAKQLAAAKRTDQVSSDESVWKSIFGDMPTRFGLVANSEKKESVENEADSMSGLSSQLNQTHDALRERGDKLGALSDKSDKLVNASNDFLSMAKELNRTSSQGFFSGW